MTQAGFTLAGAGHPIIPVMLGDAQARVGRWPSGCSTKGIYVIGFSLPGRAAGQGAHPHADVGRAHATPTSTAPIAAFAEVGRELGSLMPNESAS